MTNPITIDLPHSLGKAEARRRIASRIGDLPRHIPGGMATVNSAWSEDQLALQVAALGQEVAARVDVEERVVRVHLVLPPMLSFMSGAIAAGVKAKAGELLLGDDSHRPGRG